MEFKIEKLEKKQNEKFLIDGSKESFENLKKNAKEGAIVELDFDALNLGQKLYGSSKKESIEIQKQNCKKLMKFYKHCKKVVVFLKRKKINFDGTFFVSNVDKKKNNNDLMICAMLDVRFNVSLFKKVSKTIHHACHYLDKENEINNMCDFQNNKCVTFREKGREGTTGCCPSFCKYTKAQTCKIDNLACKIFMCNNLENKGYFFSVHNIPIMKMHLNPLERFCLAGYLFKPSRKTVRYTWLIRLLCAAYVFVFLAVLLLAIL